MAEEPEVIADLRRSRRKAWTAAVVFFFMLGAIGLMAIRQPVASVVAGGRRGIGTVEGGVSRAENRFAGYFCLALAHGAILAAWYYHGRVEREIASERATALKEAARPS